MEATERDNKDQVRLKNEWKAEERNWDVEGAQRDPGGRGEGILKGYIKLSFSTGAA